MKQRLVGAVLLAVVTAACGTSVPTAPPPRESKTPTTSSAPTSPSPTQSPSPTRSFAFEVWFLQNGKLFVTRRREAFGPGVAKIALEALLRGPTGRERKARVDTAIPNATTLRSIKLDGGIATVDVSSDISGTSGEEELRLALAQVVYTVTQFPTVKAVRLEFQGRSIGTRKLTRRTFLSLLPAILVETPAIGQSVSSPVIVRGTANVFEATVSLRVLDGQGRQIARTFTTATCGTGCRGTYSKSIRFSVSAKQPGTIEVFEESAENGEPINVVRIPVTLRP